MCRVAQPKPPSGGFLLPFCYALLNETLDETHMILGLRTAIYPVNDLAKAKDWYSQVLKMEPYFDQPFYVGFQVGGFELGLLPQGESSTTGAQPLWGVEDIETAFKRLLFLGAESLEPVTDVGEGIKVAAVKDPFGNRFGIIQNPNFNPQEVK